MFQNDVKEFCKIALSKVQLKQLADYYAYLIEFNQHTNLTAIVEKNEVYYKHFFDSLAVGRLIDFNKVETLCDMGSGAGFPSIPLKIAFPHLKVSIVDSNNKKISFLTNLVKKLNLSDVKLTHQRAEVYALKHLNEYDVVTTRALASLELVLEMGAPMVKNEGVMIIMKGAKYESEIIDAQMIMKELKVHIGKIDTFELPVNHGFRANILVEKKHSIFGFPRSFKDMIRGKK